ncbi:MAG: type II secretion system protein [Planctomycetota bacterium]|jgi:prepilin-type N-terminal cleavage/methylation domain-containing protein
MTEPSVQDRACRRLEPPAAGPRRKAFTLVELLAVIVVISILVAIVIGVSGIVTRKMAEEKTKVWMNVIRKSWSVYQETTGSYPKFYDTNGDLITNGKANNALLYDLLLGATTTWGPNDVGNRGKAKARKLLDKLPSDATGEIGSDRYFMDGFGNYLWYRPSGGAGGQPFLESSGSDNNFDNKEDNIRSDRL